MESGKRKAMAKNTYAAKLKQRKRLETDIIRQWESQFCLDMMTIVLADSEVMGKDTFGRERLSRIGQAFNRRYEECIIALSRHAENDYMRETIDRRLRQVLGESAPPWEERYEHWPEK